MPAYIILTIAIFGEVVGTAAMKASAGFTRIGPSMITLLGYAVAFFCLSKVLDRIPLGVAYAIWAGGGIVLITLAGWAIYGQRPDLPAVAGMSLIVAGVVVINLFSKSVAH